MRINSYIDISPPWKTWTLIWGTIIGLYSLQLVSYYLKVTYLAILYISISTLIFFLQQIILSKVYKLNNRSIIELNQINLPYLKKEASKFLKLWFWGNIITCILQGGFPLLWILTGSPKSYADYGFPTIQGLLNAIYSLSVIIYTLNFIYYRNRKDLIVILILLIYPIILVSRGLFTAIILELLGVYILHYKIKIKTLIIGILLTFIFIYIFGLVGDFRMGFETEYLNNLINPKYSGIMNALPSGFFWIYLYTTVSFNNLVSNLSTVVPLYYPYYSLASLLPTVIRNLVFDTNYSTKYALEMENNSFNTFTVFANFLKDFGIIGSLIIFSFIQHFSTFVYIKAKKNQIWAILSFPIIFSSIILSVFDNFFTIWFTIFQIILAKYIQTKIKKISTNVQ